MSFIWKITEDIPDKTQNLSINGIKLPLCFLMTNQLFNDKLNMNMEIINATIIP